MRCRRLIDEIVERVYPAPAPLVSATVGHVRGHENEQRVLDAIVVLREDPEFWWVWDARLSTPDEDARGIDIVVHTEILNIDVQVKSNAKASQRFRQRERNRGIDVNDMAVVVAREKDNVLFDNVKRELARVYEHRVGESPSEIASQESK